MSKYSKVEIEKIFSTLTSNLSVKCTVNKDGNIEIIPTVTRNLERFTIYKYRSNKNAVKNKYNYLLKRLNLVNGYTYKLGEKNRKRIGNNNYRPVTIENYEFNNVNEMLNYFIEYFKKHTINYNYRKSVESMFYDIENLKTCYRVG